MAGDRREVPSVRSQHLIVDSKCMGLLARTGASPGETMSAAAASQHGNGLDLICTKNWILPPT